MLCALSQVQLAQSWGIYVHDFRWMNLIKLHMEDTRNLAISKKIIFTNILLLQ